MLNQFELSSEDCVIEFLDIKSSVELLVDHQYLLPEKSQNYAPKRKEQFIAGRICALRGLRNFDSHFSGNIPIGKNREPLWPIGFVGSISHTRAHACAAVSTSLKGVGIDLENYIEEDRLQKIKKQFVLDSEEEAFSVDSKIGALIFSAKESLYKALYPTVQTFFGFKDAKILEISADSFTIQLLRSDREFSRFQEAIEGKYAIHNDMIMTLIEIKD